MRGESRPLAKVYMNGFRFFGDAVRRRVVPGLQAGEAVDFEPFPVMSEEELGQVNYPVKMTVKLKIKNNGYVLYSYALLKENAISDWKIVEAWRGQIVIQHKVHLLQRSMKRKEPRGRVSSALTSTVQSALNSLFRPNEDALGSASPESRPITLPPA